MKHPPIATPAQALREVALQFPNAQEGIACEGTSLEKRTIKAKNKAFLFLGSANAMLKLRDSLAEANALAALEPTRYKVGAHGWVTITFGDAESLPMERIIHWIDESYHLIAQRASAKSEPSAGKAKSKKKIGPKKNKLRNAGP
jgi:predicted DNA-binding protein (MmcQ/YjbR family)